MAFLRTGEAALSTKRSLRKTGAKDVERGLSLKLRIENYTSNRETKDFIVEQACLMVPGVREKSGVWYRLNRWREEQITSGKHPTYGDLVRQYIALNKLPRFEKIPHGRYINFVAEFLAAGKRRRAQRQSLRGQRSRSSMSPRTMRLGSRRERKVSQHDRRTPDASNSKSPTMAGMAGKAPYVESRRLARVLQGPHRG